MKTGEQVKNRAMSLLGYTDRNGRLDGAMYADLTARSLTLVNAIYAEVWYALFDIGFEELATLTDELDLPERVINEVMPYGVAMMLAQSIGTRTTSRSTPICTIRSERFSPTRADERM